ncbi:MAG: hypothetical protein ACTSO2_19825, partial [Promethearchaeota archaeon]
PNKIIFNGPIKSERDIKNALINRSMINFDSFYEFDIISELCSKDIEFRLIPKGIGIRINFPFPNKSISRFGFDLSQINSVCSLIKSLNNTYIRGLHCHFSTRDKSLNHYKYISEKIIKILDNLLPEYKVEYINIGGGFFGNIPKKMVENFKVSIPSPEEYAEVIAGCFLRYFGEKGPKLIIEPGISIVGDTMKFITRVIDIKKIQNKLFALTDASIFDVKPNNKRSVQFFEVIRSGNKGFVRENVDITGNTCIENDVLHNGYTGKIEKKDFIVFFNKGGYTTVLRPNFIHYAPPIVELLENGKFYILRRKEKLSDIFSVYNFK